MINCNCGCNPCKCKKFKCATGATGNTGNTGATGEAGNIGPAARVFNDQNQTIPNNTDTAINFNTVEFDTGPLFSALQPTRLTATISGKYQITAQFSISLAAAVNFTKASIKVNGITTAVFVILPNLVSQLTLDFNLTTLLNLSIGDYVELIVSQNSGINATVNGIQGSPVLSAVKVAA